MIPSTGAEPLGLEEINISHIRKILRLTHGKVHGPEGAAALLGVNPSTLRSRMKRDGDQVWQIESCRYQLTPRITG